MKSWMVGCCLVLAGCAGAVTEATKVSPIEAERLIRSDSTVVVLDVRTEDEFKGTLGHLDGALLIPIQSLGERVSELEQYRSQTIVVYCRTGGRSTRASSMLKGKGFRVLNMDGGITQWNAEHLPVVKESAREKN